MATNELSESSPKKRNSLNAIWLIALIVFCLSAGCIFGSFFSWMEYKNSGVNPSVAGSDSNMYGPGTYIVGRDIAPGLYYGKGRERSCAWRTLKDATGNYDSIINSGYEIGQFYVEISISDYAFQTECPVEMVNDQ